MKENFSKGIKAILKFSKEEAGRLKSRHIGPEHLLLGILKDKDGQANRMLRSLGADISEMKSMLEDLTLESANSISIGQPINFWPSLINVFKTLFSEFLLYLIIDEKVKIRVPL